MMVATTRTADVIQRWDALIAANRAHLQELLDEAVAASAPLIDAIGMDLTALVLPWNTIGPRVRAARDELAIGWNQISDELAACGCGHDLLRREGNKRDLASCELELMHERAYGGVMARAADRMRQVALGTDAASHACDHCGATLDRVTPVSQSLAVECRYCRCVNTVHPGDALRMFAAVGATLLAAEAARPAAEAMKRIETEMKQYRDAKDVPLALLIDFEATTRSYWTTRLTEEARYNPEAAKYVAAKLDRYANDALKTLRRYWQWREYEHKRRPA